mmetsp:Transcript_39763/g.78187  ORF Transcript_39763/g.78187 Transcript_39763/m.78187 type:complete len:204 (-) Transcript_39763:749-1360(-)
MHVSTGHRAKSSSGSYTLELAGIEVDQSDDLILVQNHVLWLDVIVSDALRMQECQALQYPNGDGFNAFDSGFRCQAVQISFFHPLAEIKLLPVHFQVPHATAAASDPGQRNDVGMALLTHNLDSFFELLQPLTRVANVVLRVLLQHYRSRLCGVWAQHSRKHLVAGLSSGLKLLFFFVVVLERPDGDMPHRNAVQRVQVWELP